MTEIREEHFLPDNSPLIKPERINQGDIEVAQSPSGRIVSAQVKDVSIMAMLVEKGFLEHFHADYGFTYLELKHCFLSPVRAKSNSIYLSLMDKPISRNEAASFYIALLRLLGSLNSNIVERAMETKYEDDAAAHCIQGVQAYRDVFDELARKVDEVRDKMKEITCK